LESRLIGFGDCQSKRCCPLAFDLTAPTRFTKVHSGGTIPRFETYDVETSTEQTTKELCLAITEKTGVSDLILFFVTVVLVLE
jgi:hypothetical protein